MGALFLVGKRAQDSPGQAKDGDEYNMLVKVSFQPENKSDVYNYFTLGATATRCSYSVRCTALLKPQVTMLLHPELQATHIHKTKKYSCRHKFLRPLKKSWCLLVFTSEFLVDVVFSKVSFFSPICLSDVLEMLMRAVCLFQTCTLLAKSNNKSM